MQRFWALEQVSVVLASCQPFFRRTCLVMTARILPKPCSAYLFAIGAHGLRHLFCPHLKPHKGYRFALSRAAPYKIKNQCSHPFLCEHKWVGALVFNFARLKPNVHIYTVGLPSGGLLLPGIVRLGVRCLF